MVPYILTDDILTIVLRNKPYTITQTHPNYDEIITGLRYNFDESVLLSLIDLPSQLQKYLADSDLVFDLNSSVIRYKGEIVVGTLTKRILELYKRKLDIQPMILFMINLYQNPSETAIKELYDFIEYGHLPITEDGHFLAYKRVRLNYTSFFDNKTLNRVGDTVSMSRASVDDSRHNLCSRGLHLCSHSYLPEYHNTHESRVMIIKVNPKDVVAIPTDYNNTKARACCYEIVGELNIGQQETVAKNESVLDPVIDHEQKYVPDTAHSIEFKCAYSRGYKAGRDKVKFFQYSTMAGEKIFAKGKVAYHISEQQAKDIDAGYELGYKHGKNHKSRLYPIMDYEDFSIEEFQK